MNQVGSALKGGFTYNVDHIRSIARMMELGQSIDGLPQVNVIKRKARTGINKIIGGLYDVLGLRHLNEIIVPSVVLSTEEVHNLIPTEGINYILGAALDGTSPISTWYIAPFEGNYTPVAGVTASSFTSSATESTAYDEATRVEWVPGAVVAGSMSNSASKAVFTFNASKTIYGIGQLSVSAKSATTGVLVSIARFASSKAVVDDDVLNVTSTIVLASI
jgi:hypothetical protein